MVKNDSRGWLIIFLLCLIPIVIWSISSPLFDRFNSFYGVLTSIGQITGLLGLSMYALSLFLSGRFKFIEDFFGGMNKVYIAHHLLGGLSFILVMIHPLTLAFAYLPFSTQSVITYILPGSDWAINFGITSLLLTMVLLFITFFTNLPYEIWRTTHKFMGLTFSIGIIHSFFVSSDISRDPVLKAYMLFLVLLGIFPYIYRTILFKYVVKRYEYLVKEVKYYSDNIVEIFLAPTMENISYMPGQFIFVSLEESDLPKETHPFSLTSIPTENLLSFASKVEGDFTKKLMSIKVDTKVKIEGGFGRFNYLGGIKKKQIWIGAGIGITPFISMAKNLNNNTGYDITLYYEVKNEEEAVFLKTLNDIALVTPNFKVTVWYSQKDKHLTAERIAQIDSSYQDKDIYICGPQKMMKAITNDFAKMGLNKSRLHSEEFNML